MSSTTRHDTSSPHPEHASDSQDNQHLLGRREFLHGAGGLLAAAGLTPLALAQNPQQPPPPNIQNYVQLPPIQNVQTEGQEKAPGPFEPTDQRIGFAIVGLGRLSIDQILPAFGSIQALQTRSSRQRQRGDDHSPNVRLDSSKALKIAAQYGIKPSSIYHYDNFEQLAENPEVKVVYIVLPNSMHAEYTVRAAKIGKHVLCEKPMATSVADCEKMIAACKAANVKLMVAYRQQYEPKNREIVKMIRAGKLGPAAQLPRHPHAEPGRPQPVATPQGALRRRLPARRRHLLPQRRALLVRRRTHRGLRPDLPARRRPALHRGRIHLHLHPRFPSGLLASCTSGFAAHHSSFARMEGADSWTELSPSFGYSGLKLRSNKLLEGHTTDLEPTIGDKDQFALEMDHMALCVMRNQQPHTPGEEGLQDIRIIEAIYESARTNRPVKLAPPPAPTRGPEPQEA